MGDYSLDCGVRKAAKRGDRARSSMGDESAESRTIVRLRVERSKGSNAYRNIVAYFFRSDPNQPCHSANARTRSLGTEDSLSVMMFRTPHNSGSGFLSATMHPISYVSVSLYSRSFAPAF